MNTLIQWLMVICALVVLAEGLNKIERADPGADGLSFRRRVAEWLKSLAWVLLSIGAALYAAAGLLGGSAMDGLDRWAGPLMLFGFAVLVVRTRVKEG